jgi:hypothetical protein
MRRLALVDAVTQTSCTPTEHATPGGLVHPADPLPVNAIGALEAQINQLYDFAEVLRQQLEATLGPST